MFIYILELENGKYYIGRTTNIARRIQEHINQLGSSWTKKYKYVRTIETIKTDDPFDEDKYVKKYMSKYGIDNVRGGSYVLDSLTANEIKFIERELRGASDKCFKCGGEHFVNDCDQGVFKGRNFLQEHRMYNSNSEESSGSDSSYIESLSDSDSSYIDSLSESESESEDESHKQLNIEIDEIISPEYESEPEITIEKPDVYVGDISYGSIRNYSYESDSEEDINSSESELEEDEEGYWSYKQQYE